MKKRCDHKIIKTYACENSQNEVQQVMLIKKKKKEVQQVIIIKKKVQQVINMCGLQT